MDDLDKLIHELNLQKFEYNRKELTAIRNRAHQFLAFSLIIISIVIAILSTNTLKEISDSGILLGVLIAGFTALLIVMVKCYLIMIKGYIDPLLNPEAVYNTFANGDFKTNFNDLRQAIFNEHGNIDQRNLEIKRQMRSIYCLAPISIIIIFIPIIVSFWL